MTSNDGRRQVQIPSSLRTQDASRVAQLEQACRKERRLGLAGHWSYDLPRHLELLRQLKAAREEAR